MEINYIKTSQTLKAMLYAIILISIAGCNFSKSQEIDQIKEENKILDSKLKQANATIQDINTRNTVLRNLISQRDNELSTQSTLKQLFTQYIECMSRNNIAEMKDIENKILSLENNSSEAIAVKILSSKNSIPTDADKSTEHGGPKKQDAEQEQNKPKQVTLKDFKVTNRTTIGDVEINEIQVKTTKKWVFDSNNYDYHYKEADKGSVFLVTNFTVTSKNKNPELPIPVVAKLNNDGKVVIVGISDIEFPSWTDYGSYLGNYHDSKNDFAKRNSIKFTAGVQVSEEDYKSKKLFIFIPSINCAERHEGDGSPPVSYFTFSCEEKIKKHVESNGVQNVIKIFN